jgi:hypothetical protein
MYNSLFENNRYGLVPLKEASFGTQVKDKMFKIFGSLLSKRIGKPVYTSAMMMDLFKRDSSVYGGVWYYIGDAGERLRINISMEGDSSRPYSIDYWPSSNYSDDKAFVSIEIPVTMNLVQMMDYMTNVVKEKGRIPLDDGSDLDFMGEAVTPQTIELVTDWIEQSGYDIPYLLKMKAEPLLNDYNASGSVEMDIEDFGGSLNKYLQSNGVHYAKLKRFRRGANKPKGGAASPISKPKSKTKPVATKPSVSKPVLTAKEKLAQQEYEKYKVYDTDLQGSIGLLKDSIRNIASGVIKGVLVTGSPGVGKSYTTQSILKDEFGLTENVDYVLERGGETSTPAFYRLLYDNIDKLIMLDDNDGIWKDQKAVGMIKGALETQGSRMVTSNNLNMGDYPTSFIFEGQLIFITNLVGADLKLASPVKTRVDKIHFNISKEEIIKYIAVILDKIYPNVDIDIKMEVFEWFDLMGDKYASAKEEGVSIRAFTLTLDKRISGMVNWKQDSLNKL